MHYLCLISENKKTRGGPSNILGLVQVALGEKSSYIRLLLLPSE